MPKARPNLVQREHKLILCGFGAPLVGRHLPPSCHDSIEILYDRLGGALEVSEPEWRVDLAAPAVLEGQAA